MKCEMTITRNLKGFTNITITTPQGTKLLVNLVAKKKETLKKLLYKVVCEYEEDNKQKATDKKSK